MPADHPINLLYHGLASRPDEPSPVNPDARRVFQRADDGDGVRQPLALRPAGHVEHGQADVGCLYLPNGNPAPGPRFDYKLRWFDRLAKHAESLLVSGQPVVLAGDYNVMPTDLDVYAPERWVDDALFRPEVREAYRRLVAQGWTDALREQHPGERIYTFWKYFRNAFFRDAGLPHRSSAAQSPIGEAPHRGRRRP